MADNEQGQDRPTPASGSGGDPDARHGGQPRSGHPAHREARDVEQTGGDGTHPTVRLPARPDTRMVLVRPGILLVLLLLVVILTTVVVMLWITRPTSGEASSNPQPSSTQPTSSTTSSTSGEETPTSLELPSEQPPSSGEPTVAPTAAPGGSASASWTGQLVLDDYGISIAQVPPKRSESGLNSDIKVHLMDDDTETDTLGLDDGTYAVRLDKAQSASTAADCQRLIEHDRSGNRLQVRVGDRVCVQNGQGDVALFTVRQRYPEGAIFALRIDLQVWLHQA